MRKLLNDIQLMNAFADLWEGRQECFRLALVWSAFWTATMFVFWYMWTVAGGVGALASWAIAWAIPQAIILIHAWLKIRDIDRLAMATIDRSEAFNKLVGS